MTRQILVGGVKVGGGAPVTLQSMCNTKTEDVEATVAQIRALTAAGCEIVRVAVPGPEAARAIGEIRPQIAIPLVADIHFDYKLALTAAAAGCDKIRINPGNIGDPERVRAVADCCRERGIPIRIGVNGGSLEPRLLEKYGGPCPEAMAESALEQAGMLERFDFSDICISVKSSRVPDTIAAYRILSERCDYPLHLGVTEAGTAYMGTVRSAMGIGALLCMGIGDTMRVTLTADPVEEIRAGRAILQAAGHRRGLRIVSCPTCGRTQIDIISLAKEVEDRLAGCDRDLTVAVMGCTVNGPGEAREADVGITGGRGEGLLFLHGKVVKKVPEDRLVDELIALIDTL